MCLVHIDDITTDEGQPGRHASWWPTRLFVLATSPEMMVDKVICACDIASDDGQQGYLSRRHGQMTTNKVICPVDIARDKINNVVCPATSPEMTVNKVIKFCPGDIQYNFVSV